ncbi:MAG: glycosyl hydrolase family 88 [Hamadaea sp.]|uniref:glycoside hydrolase family 88 protein n=1 Tax=Hamadaea sp. TaxID=2024425 RepID=UPI0017CF74FB|nr:glycoside hydrolase family 88 protein [Hamadaea sp.]NUR69866.1 glycosyl hydrolase family 88 [Hamadaea sp.]NUT22062.1 glycosyl hydrolase family 88 [Hamadaea sp.]
MDRRTLLKATALAPLAPLAPRQRPATAAIGLTRTEILNQVRLVQTYWIDTHRNPGDNKWARATYFSGHLAAYRATGENLRYAQKWAQQNAYALNGGTTTRNADNQCAGQAYYDLFDVDHDASHLTAVDESIRLMAYGSNQSNSDWWWCDALHMAMPVFARVRVHTGDPAYSDKLWQLFSYTKNLLWDAVDHLWYRDANYVYPTGSQCLSPNGKKVFWSRGNGWVLAGLAKTHALLPVSDPRRADYAALFQQHAAALIPVQRSDGFWNVNLADPLHRPGPETSGTAFFTFGLAYGIRAGLLDPAIYLPAATNAWNGMTTVAVRSDGLLGYVQGTGANPDSSQPVTSTSTADFGVGAFLLAGTELAKLTS